MDKKMVYLTLGVTALLLITSVCVGVYITDKQDADKDKGPQEVVIEWSDYWPGDPQIVIDILLEAEGGKLLMKNKYVGQWICTDLKYDGKLYYVSCMMDGHPAEVLWNDIIRVWYTK